MRKSFQLLELVVVLIIVGVIASFTVPNFIRMRDQGEFKTALAGLRAIRAAQQQHLLEEGSYLVDVARAPRGTQPPEQEEGDAHLSFLRPPIPNRRGVWTFSCHYHTSGMNLPAGYYAYAVWSAAVRRSHYDGSHVAMNLETGDIYFSLHPRHSGLAAYSFSLYE